MHIERMNHLAAILEPVQPSVFHLGVWKCGTTACAIGHAAQDPVFKEQGFGLMETEWLQNPDLPEPVLRTENGVLEAWEAICAFFLISRQEAHRLFTEEAYPANATPQDVVARIRRMVELEQKMVLAHH
jgi:hypothetical protein